jgi:hypothetical protein
MVYFLTRLDCQSNAKPSEKHHDLTEIQTRNLWSSSQHTQPLHHLVRHRHFILYACAQLRQFAEKSDKFETGV